MKRLILSALALVSLLVASVAPATAGGWATARLDDPPGEIGVGAPWRFDFTVRAHDISPVNVGDTEIYAHHRNGHYNLIATATQEGAEGHYVGELTFPEAGDWKWGVTTEPYGQLPFETLVVGRPDQQAKAAEPATVLNLNTANLQLVRGDCSTTGEARSDPTLNMIARPTDQSSARRLSDTAASTDAVPVWHGTARTTTSVEELIADRVSLAVVTESASEMRSVACGAVRGTLTGDDMIVGLAEQSGSGQAGIAMLSDAGGRTDVDVFLVATTPPGGGAVGEAAEATSTEIVIAGMAFSPRHVTIPAGATVQWQNADAVVHSVTGNDLSFSDSPLLEQDQTYSQRFDLPGTYIYYCGPHPNMTATIEVT